MSVNVPHIKVPNTKTVEKWTIGKERISRTGDVRVCVCVICLQTCYHCRDPQRLCRIMLEASLLILLKNILVEMPWENWYASNITIRYSYRKQLYMYNLQYTVTHSCIV